MITVSENGREKRFIARCSKCMSDLEFGLSDVEAEDTGEDWALRYRHYLTGPICGEKFSVALITREDHERMRQTPLSFCPPGPTQIVV